MLHVRVMTASNISSLFSPCPVPGQAALNSPVNSPREEAFHEPFKAPSTAMWQISRPMKSKMGFAPMRELLKWTAWEIHAAKKKKKIHPHSLCIMFLIWFNSRSTPTASPFLIARDPVWYYAKDGWHHEAYNPLKYTNQFHFSDRVTFVLFCFFFGGGGLKSLFYFFLS